jgi:hypothetical protein
MNIEDLNRFLETRQRSMSEQEFFELIFDMLEDESSNEAREILESLLVRSSYLDGNRVARYLEQFLYDRDPQRMKFAILELINLADTPDSLAEKILVKFSEAGSALFLKEKFLGKAAIEEAKSEELEQYLESHRKSLPEKEFFELVLDMLNHNPLAERRDILKRYLLAYSFVDKDRVARYLEQFLSDADPLQREFAAHDLALLAREPNSLAYKILTDYLGEEPTKDKKIRIMMDRMIKLFPRPDDNES